MKQFTLSAAVAIILMTASCRKIEMDGNGSGNGGGNNTGSTVTLSGRITQTPR